MKFIKTESRTDRENAFSVQYKKTRKYHNFVDIQLEEKSLNYTLAWDGTSMTANLIYSLRPRKIVILENFKYSLQILSNFTIFYQ